MDNIKALRIFFAASNAAFELQQNIHEIMGVTYINPMHQLHMIAQQEVNKETPDFNKVDFILKQMEDLADKNSKKK